MSVGPCWELAVHMLMVQLVCRAAAGAGRHAVSAEGGRLQGPERVGHRPLHPQVGRMLNQLTIVVHSPLVEHCAACLPKAICSDTKLTMCCRVRDKRSLLDVAVDAATCSTRWSGAERPLPATARPPPPRVTSSSTSGCCRPATPPAPRAGALLSGMSDSYQPHLRHQRRAHQIIVSTRAVW
jgi:hypothetical protein